MADSFPKSHKSKKTTKLNVIVPKHKSSFTLLVPVGTCLSEIVGDPTIADSELLEEYLPISCGGNMSCSSCHVYLKDGIEYKNSLKGNDGGIVDVCEDDMLDLAFGFVEGESRLGCQVCVPEEGLTVTIPDGMNDFWS